MTDITQETATLVTMLAHQGQVSALLRELARRLEARADYHDLSKFRPDEFAGFVEVNRIAREHPYGSAEYKESLKDNHTIDLHFSRNRHHPEYHTGGVNGMNLIDFIEMVIDWIAASRTYGTTSWEDVIKEQQKRFGLTDCQLATIGLILELFDEV
jgi:Family of unknown function (DUF5662)